MSVNLLAQFFYAFMVKNYSLKVGGTQLQNKSISGTQQEKGWKPLLYSLLGRTSQRLQDRIRQHVPKSIRNKTNQERIQPTRKSKINSSSPNCDSAIGTHLLKHPNCALHYNDDQFSILSKPRSKFHLAVLESIHITSSKPAMYRQKEFVYRLKIINMIILVLIFFF